VDAILAQQIEIDIGIGDLAVLAETLLSASSTPFS